MPLEISITDQLPDMTKLLNNFHIWKPPFEVLCDDFQMIILEYAALRGSRFVE